jgi:hypothetical protein
MTVRWSGFFSGRNTNRADGAIGCLQLVIDIDIAIADQPAQTPSW